MSRKWIMSHALTGFLVGSLSPFTSCSPCLGLILPSTVPPSSSPPVQRRCCDFYGAWAGKSKKQHEQQRSVAQRKRGPPVKEFLPRETGSVAAQLSHPSDGSARVNINTESKPAISMSEITTHHHQSALEELAGLYLCSLVPVMSREEWYLCWAARVARTAPGLHLQQIAIVSLRGPSWHFVKVLQINSTNQWLHLLTPINKTDDTSINKYQDVFMAAWDFSPLLRMTDILHYVTEHKNRQN